MRASRVLKAVAASFRTGWEIVVSGGQVARAAAMSSKPTTATSSGTRLPMRERVSISIIACSSFPQTMASGLLRPRPQGAPFFPALPMCFQYTPLF
jgi:hypothetical protein